MQDMIKVVMRVLIAMGIGLEVSVKEHKQDGKEGVPLLFWKCFNRDTVYYGSIPISAIGEALRELIGSYQQMPRHDKTRAS